MALTDALSVTTIAVTDLEDARRFYGEQLGLPLLDETPFALRFGAGKGSQISVRRGSPNVGNTVAHFEVSNLDADMAELRSRASSSRNTSRRRPSTALPRSARRAARG